MNQLNIFFEFFTLVPKISFENQRFTLINLCPKYVFYLLVFQIFTAYSKLMVAKLFLYLQIKSLFSRLASKDRDDSRTE